MLIQPLRADEEGTEAFAGRQQGVKDARGPALVGCGYLLPLGVPASHLTRQRPLPSCHL